MLSDLLVSDDTTPRRGRPRPNPNFDEIIPRLYLGNYMTAIDKSIMSCLGITHLITLDHKKIAPHQIPKTVKSYLHLNVIDHSEQIDIMSHFKMVDEFIGSALKIASNKIYVHCVSGISRSPALVVAYIMKSKKLCHEKAIKFVKKKRPITNLNKGFVRQLVLYEKMNYEINIENKNYRSLIFQDLIFEYRKLVGNYESLSSSIEIFEAQRLTRSQQFQENTILKRHINQVLFKQYYSKVSFNLIEQFPNVYRTDEVYKCIRCKVPIFYPVSIIDSINSTVCISVNTCIDQLNKFTDEKECEFIYIEPQPWMINIHVLRGNINCSNCIKELGKFDWINQFSCNCHLPHNQIFKIYKKYVHTDVLTKNQ